MAAGRAENASAGIGARVPGLTNEAKAAVTSLRLGAAACACAGAASLDCAAILQHAVTVGSGARVPRFAQQA